MALCECTVHVVENSRPLGTVTFKNIQSVCQNVLSIILIVMMSKRNLLNLNMNLPVPVLPVLELPFSLKNPPHPTRQICEHVPSCLLPLSNLNFETSKL